MQLSGKEIAQHINRTRESSIWETLDITVVTAEKDLVVLTMPVGPAQRQQAGYLHGGASLVLAESAASLGAALNCDMERQATFGLEINANHLRPKREGRLFATATPLHKGRTTHVWDIRITDENDKLICVSRCTVAIVERPPEAINPMKK